MKPCIDSKFKVKQPKTTLFILFQALTLYQEELARLQGSMSAKSFDDSITDENSKDDEKMDIQKSFFPTKVLRLTDRQIDKETIRHETKIYIVRQRQMLVSSIHNQVVIHKDRLKDRQTDRQINRQAQRLTDSCIDKWTDRQIQNIDKKQTNTKSELQEYGSSVSQQKDRQMNRQTDTWRDRQIDRSIDRLKNKVKNSID